MAGVLATPPAAIEAEAAPTAAGALRAGWSRLRARGGVAVVAIWLTVTVVAVAVVVPAWAWWNGALAPTIDGARLLGSPNVATLAELLRDSPFAMRAIASAALAGAGLMVLLNPFLAGGLLGALASDPPPAGRGRVARFAHDGAAAYGPLLRVALIVWPIALVVVAVAAVVAGLPFVRGARPALSLFASGLVLAAGALGATMLVDLARAYVVCTGSRRALAAVGAAVGIAMRHVTGLAVAAIAFGGALALALAALLLFRAWLPGDVWPGIVLGIVAQQVHGLARTWLRAALVSTELVIVEADLAARASAAASRLAVEERPEVFVVVEREAGEGRPIGDEGSGGADLSPQVAGGLPADGDGARGDVSSVPMASESAAAVGRAGGSGCGVP